MDEQQDSFTAKLNRLFREKTKPDGSIYTQTDVIVGTNDVVNRVYLWKLLTGRATNPSIQVVQALADFFGVAPSYFFESTENADTFVPNKRQELLTVLRSFGLDKDEQKAITLMIEALKTSKEVKKVEE
jgi:transcriptional regulator with XRE-family HTH domain